MKRVTVNALIDIDWMVTLIPSFVTGLAQYLILP